SDRPRPAAHSTGAYASHVTPVVKRRSRSLKDVVPPARSGAGIARGPEGQAPASLDARNPISAAGGEQVAGSNPGFPTQEVPANRYFLVSRTVAFRDDGDLRRTSQRNPTPCASAGRRVCVGQVDFRATVMVKSPLPVRSEGRSGGMAMKKSLVRGCRSRRSRGDRSAGLGVRGPTGDPARRVHVHLRPWDDDLRADLRLRDDIHRAHRRPELPLGSGGAGNRDDGDRDDDVGVSWPAPARRPTDAEDQQHVGEHALRVTHRAGSCPDRGGAPPIAYRIGTVADYPAAP